MSGPANKTAGLSREELLVVIENQADQIKRFELRLRDTVSACKSLMKQKEALEASLQILSKQKKTPEDAASSSHSVSPPSDDPKTSSVQASAVDFASGSSVPAASSEDTVSSLRQQISTLSQSLATITTEKVRLEQLIIAEKRTLRNEYESKIEVISAEKERLAEEIRELRLRLSAQSQHLSHPTGGETGDLSPRRERPHRVSSEQQFHREANEAYQPGQPLLERLRNQLRETEARLFALQQTSSAKDVDANALEIERERADRAEMLAGESEVRLRVLEQRIAELTSEIGRCEAAGARDKSTIEKLEVKLRDAQLANKPQWTATAPTPAPRSTASFGTQTTDLPVSSVPGGSQQASLMPPQSPKTVEVDHSHCRERIATLEGALAMARKDFADAVSRSWLTTASQATSVSGNKDRTVYSDDAVEQQQTPDLLLRPTMQQNVPENVTEVTSRKISPQPLSQPMYQSSTAEDIDFVHGNESRLQSSSVGDRPKSFDGRHIAEDDLNDDDDVEDGEGRKNSGAGAPLLFYETELSRLNSALRDARTSNRRLERRFRESEQRLTAEKMALQQSVDKLQRESGELKRAAASLPPDSAKLEFIRQVVMRHLSTSDSKVRTQTATVLATALSFPPEFSLPSASSTAQSSSSGVASGQLSRFFKS